MLELLAQVGGLGLQVGFIGRSGRLGLLELLLQFGNLGLQFALVGRRNRLQLLAQAGDFGPQVSVARGGRLEGLL